MSKDKLNQISNILSDPFPETLYPQLNELERMIAQMTVEGMTASQISEALKSPIGTVNTYLRMIYKAFGVRRNAWAKIVFDRIREVLED